MLQKITFKKYSIASAIAIVVAYFYQLSLHQNCAWDGCYATKGFTFISSMFGLPVGVLGIVILFGIVLSIPVNIHKRSVARRKPAP